jgi:beta-lactamase superfamily II metal-dependent hydrolase
VRNYLTSLGVTKLDLVIASHNHSDHIGGLAEVVRRYKPTYYMDNAVPATTLVQRRVFAPPRCQLLALQRWILMNP